MLKFKGLQDSVFLSVFQLAFCCKKELVLSLRLWMYSFISIIRPLDCILLSSDPLLSNISIARLSQIWSVGDHLSCVVLLRLCRSLNIFLFTSTGRYCSLILCFTCPTPGISQFARVLVLFRVEWYSEVSIWMSAVLIAIGVSLYPGILGGHSQKINLSKSSNSAFILVLSFTLFCSSLPTVNNPILIISYWRCFAGIFSQYKLFSLVS